MATSPALKNNKAILFKNLDIIEDNLQVLQEELGTNCADMRTEIYIIRQRLSEARSDCAFCRVFIDFFVLLHQFHKLAEEKGCSELIAQKYTGYLVIESF